MRGLQRHGVVEDHPDRVDRRPPCRRQSSVKPDGAFIQALAATTDTLPKIPARTIGNTGPEVRPRLQPAPAEDVDRDEDRLGEEEDALEGERHAERLAPLAHEPRPQQAELEAQHGAGHRAHRERHRHVLRPALGQQERVPVVVLDGPVVGDQRHEGPRHAERHQDDVEHQGERHLRPGPRHRIHSGEHGRSAERRDHLDHSLPGNALGDTWIVDEKAATRITSAGEAVCHEARERLDVRQHPRGRDIRHRGVGRPRVAVVAAIWAWSCRDDREDEDRRSQRSAPTSTGPCGRRWVRCQPAWHACRRPSTRLPGLAPVTTVIVLGFAAWTRIVAAGTGSGCRWSSALRCWPPSPRSLLVAAGPGPARPSPHRRHRRRGRPVDLLRALSARRGLHPSAPPTT